MKNMIQIFKCKTEKEYEETLDVLSKQASDIYNAREKEVMEALENDTQKIIFMDWWTGGILKQYDDKTESYLRVKKYEHVSDHDWDIVHGYIMETISLGMG